MLTPRINFASRLTAALPIFACLLVVGLNTIINAQQQATNVVPNERDRGIGLYQQGSDKEAVEVLRQFVKEHGGDVAAWHYLGLALARQGKTDDARQAHEKAAKLGEKALDRIFESVRPENFSASAKLYEPMLKEAADSADKYLELSSKPSKSKAQEWSDHAAMLRKYAQLFETNSSDSFKVYTPNEVTTKARILSRTEPEYTAEARAHHVAGTIVLRGILAFDGKVRSLRVTSALPDGLTENALRAAGTIKFVPATKDGKPVSQYTQIEYSFNTGLP